MTSKFAPHGVILKYIPTAMVVASLGNRTWGALGLPLREIHSEDDAGDDVFAYCFEPRGEVKWLHIIAADDWVVVPHVAPRCAHGFVVKISGAEQPLPMHILQTNNKSLMTDVDLHRLQKHMGLVPAGLPMPNIDSLIGSLARHYECDAAD